MNKYLRISIIIIVFLLIIGAIFYFEGQKSQRSTDPEGSEIILDVGEALETKSEKFEFAKEITTPDGFINVESTSVAEHIGKKVILVDFWTYSCINCQRTLPYLNAWHEKYADQGLVILGVHTPEFEFEKEYDNVVRAVEKFNVQYPVILDNDFSTWNAYRNRFWPRKYLIDVDGFIVYDHIGEGGYDETERKIQELLREKTVRLGEDMALDFNLVDPEDAESIEGGGQRTPELYFGSLRNEYLGNGIRSKEGIQILEDPVSKKTNELYLVGEWEFTGEFARSITPGARIILRYQAEKVFVVMSSKEGVNITVMVDGGVVSGMGGSDVTDGKFFVQDEGLYRIIEDPAGYGVHTLELIIEEAGLDAFAFTFG